jgi:hypothetical protein
MKQTELWTILNYKLPLYTLSGQFDAVMWERLEGILWINLRLLCEERLEEQQKLQ